MDQVTDIEVFSAPVSVASPTDGNARPVTFAQDKSSETTPATPHKKTSGEVKFDVVTYGVLGGLVNFLGSMWCGYEARYGRFAPKIEKMTQSIQKMGLKRHSAETAVMTTALMMGGNAIVPVIKTAEHYRTPIINSLNAQNGEPPIKEHTQIKQSWDSLIKSRIVAWAMVFAAFKGAVMLAGEQKFEQFEKSFARNIVCKPLGKPTHLHGAETRLYRYGRIAALDIFATAASACLLYCCSRFFGKKHAGSIEEDTVIFPLSHLVESEPENVSPPEMKPDNVRRAGIKPAGSYAERSEMPAAISPGLA